MDVEEEYNRGSEKVQMYGEIQKKIGCACKEKDKKRNDTAETSVEDWEKEI